MAANEKKERKKEKQPSPFSKGEGCFPCQADHLLQINAV